jgi:hypothetical protein
MTMNWEALGALGELAGAVSVVVTLFYVALQVPQMQKTARVVAQRDVLLRVSEWFRMSHTLENQGYDIFTSGLQEYDKADALPNEPFDSVVCKVLSSQVRIVLNTGTAFCCRALIRSSIVKPAIRGSTS